MYFLLINECTYDGVRRSAQRVRALDVLKNVLAALLFRTARHRLIITTLIIITTTIIILSWTKVREVKTDTSDPSTVSPPLKLPPHYPHPDPGPAGPGSGSWGEQRGLYDNISARC